MRHRTRRSPGAGTRATSKDRGGATSDILRDPADIAKALNRRARLTFACDLFGLLVLAIVLVRAVAG